MACSLKKGELVKLKNGVSHLQKFSHRAVYKIEAVIRVACSPTLRFKLSSGRQDAPLMYFEPLAAEYPREDPALQIAALTTVYEKLQDPEMRGLKRKLEETLQDQAEGTRDMIAEARRDIRSALQDSKTDYRAALTAAYNAMCDTERQLRDNDSEVSESNSDED